MLMAVGFKYVKNPNQKKFKTNPDAWAPLGVPRRPRKKPYS